MCLVPRCHILSLTEDKPCQVAIHNLEVLPFRAAVLEDEVVEEESHTLSGYGVLHNDILYPRGAMRLVISRPCKAKGRDATRARIAQSPSFGRRAPELDLYMPQASRNPLHEEFARSSVRSARICLPSAIHLADATKSFASQGCSASRSEQVSASHSQFTGTQQLDRQFVPTVAEPNDGSFLNTVYGGLPYA